MGNRQKIKKVKDYLKEGPPQFDVILRLSPGKTVDVHIVFGEQSLVMKTLTPPESGEGIIKIVKRISDDVLFHQSDMVDVDGKESVFIMEFREDRIHCSVAGLFDQEPFDVEINQLTAHEILIGAEAEEAEENMEDEDYEIEDFIDEQ